MITVGVVGLGEMGGGFVDRLLDAEQPVVGWNRTKAKAARLVARGLRWASTPRAVAAESDVVLTMVANGRALDAVTLGDDGILAGIRGKVLVEMSTIAPAEVKALADRTVLAGGELLDAPVLGAAGLTLEIPGAAEGGAAVDRPEAS